MTCYRVLGQAVLFHVGNVCKLPSAKHDSYNVFGLPVLIMCLTPLFHNSFLT